MISRLLFISCALLFSWNLHAQFPCFPGEIELSPGFEASFCDGDDDPDLIRFTSRPMALPRAYVVVDENDVIVSIGYSNTINFDGLGDNLRVYSFTLIGSITAEVGDILTDVELASGCFALSANFIEIDTNGGQDGGLLEGGPFTFCVGDDEPDFIPDGALTLTGVNGQNTTWVVTDADGNILGLPASPYEVDFDGAGLGACLVWNLSFIDGLEGAEVGNNAADLEGCFDLSNPITVNRIDGPECEDCEAEVGALIGGPFTFCVGDGVADFIEDGAITIIGDAGPNTTWVVTDADGNILGLADNYAAVDFDDAGVGTCLVRYLGFEDGLEGAIVGNNVADLVGCFELSNLVTVNRVNGPDCEEICTVNGGILEGGTYEFCVGDGEGDFIEPGSIVLTGATGPNATWVVTDADGNILGLPADYADVNFDGAGVGACLVWYLSFEDGLEGAAVGNNATDLVGCFDLSNPITVTRVDGPDCEDLCNLNGGFLTGGPFNFCVGDGVADFIPAGAITPTGFSGAVNLWVITDADGNILGFPANYSNNNFENAGAGNCLVWYLSFETGLAGANIGLNIDDLEGCFDLSNPITVTRDAVEGGTLTGGSFSFCVGDGESDFIPADAITVSGAVGQNNAWVVTDEDGNILGLPDNYADVDFDGAGPGACLVWYLSFDDGLEGAVVGNNTADLVGCFELSNPITVNRGQPEGGTLEGGPYSFCVADGEPSMIPEDDIIQAGSSGGNNAWVITDEAGIILGLPPTYSVVDFDAAGVGTCLVWYLSYEDGISGLAVGQNTNDLEGCFDFSNPLTVNRGDLDGGELTGGPFSFCVGDGIPDIISADEVTLTGSFGTNMRWVVTDTDGVILAASGNVENLDFDVAGPGTCLLRNLSFVPGIGAQIGRNIDELVGCFDFSNPLTVERTTVMGGTVMTSDGETDITVNVGDGNSDEIEFTVSGNIGENFTYVVTDENNIILDVPTGNSVDFEGVPTGVCRVWGLAYSGTLIAQPGDDAAAVNLSDECFSLSESFVTVNRVNPFGTGASAFSLRTNSERTLRIFPNPATDHLQVNLTAGTQPSTLTIISLNGKVLDRRVLAAEQVSVTLDVDRLPAGTYFLRSNDGVSVATQRFVKQ